MDATLETAQSQLPADGGDILVLDTTGVDAVAVPGADFLKTARFFRSGHDLLLRGADGTEILVRNYFSLENPPDLTAEDGEVVTADRITTLAGPLEADAEDAGEEASAEGEEDEGEEDDGEDLADFETAAGDEEDGEDTGDNPFGEPPPGDPFGEHWGNLFGDPPRGNPFAEPPRGNPFGEHWGNPFGGPPRGNPFGDDDDDDDDGNAPSSPKVTVTVTVNGSDDAPATPPLLRRCVAERAILECRAGPGGDGQLCLP